MTTYQANPLKLGRKAKPTKQHRPAVWECMLGTVYAFNGTEVRYFDYRWDEAVAFAGPLLDPRTWRAGYEHQRTFPGQPGATITARRRVLWTK